MRGIYGFLLDEKRRFETNPHPFAMKKILLLFCAFIQIHVWAQTSFPASWAGTWEGDLHIYGTGKTYPDVRMRLIIKPIEGSDRWQWTILYLAEKTDERAYELAVVDSASGHYFIDEKNSIELDAYLRGNSFISRFAVEKNLLDVIYTLEGDAIRFQVCPGSTKPVRKSGKKAEGIKGVASFPVSSYQVAVLRRVE
jgi:hypothetical protein